MGLIGASSPGACEGKSMARERDQGVKGSGRVQESGIVQELKRGRNAEEVDAWDGKGEW